MEHLARRRARLDELTQHLKRRDQAVAGGGVIAQDDVARLLAADIVAALAHPLEHVTIADRGADQAQALRLHMAFEPKVGHDGRDQPAARQPAAPRPAARDRRHQLIAVDDPAVFVAHDQAIGIAIERDADRRA